jgi:hypothetical protein
MLKLSCSVTSLELISSQLNPSLSGELVLYASTFSNTPYRNRCSFLAATEPDDDVHETTTLSDRLEILKRPKIDPMTVLPEDDIADMHEVFNVICLSEVFKWTSRKVLEFFMKSLTFHSSVVGNEWECMYA